jgi:hypothetical protein
MQAPPEVAVIDAVSGGMAVERLEYLGHRVSGG